MKSKIVQIPVSVVLTVIGMVPTVFLFFLFSVGFLVALFVEVFKFYSRISNSELTEYKISKLVEKPTLHEKTKKIIKLPLPDKAVSKRMVYLHDQYEEELSKFR
jgi:hypothetical protein